MRLSVLKEDLYNGLTEVVTVLGKKSVIPVLSHVLLEATEEGEIFLSATNLDMWVRSNIAGDIEEAGKIAVPGNLFQRLVRELPSGENVLIEASMSGTARNLQISCSGEYSLNGLPAEEFPNVPDFEVERAYTVDCRVFQDMVSRTQFAVGKEDFRPNLMGLYWAFVGQEDGSGISIMVGTDGHRLSRVITDNADASEQEVGETVSRVIPPVALTTAANMFKGITEFNVGFGESYLRMDTQRKSIWCLLLNVDFPDYERFIPQDNDKSVELDRNKFHKAVKKISILADNASKRVWMTFGDNGIILRTTTQDVGKGNVRLPIEYDGDEVEFSFNSRYWLEILGAIHPGPMQITFHSSLRACLVNSLKTDGIDHLALIMPLRA